MTRSAPRPAEQLDDIAARLDWLRRLLSWHVAVTRQTYGELADDPHRGLYVPDAEVDLISAGEDPLPQPLAQERAALALERQELAGSARGRLSDLAGRFGLDAFAQDIVLLALAPEIDLRFERLYAYIQDDVTRRRPSVELALRLLCRGPAERHAARQAFAAGAPLLRRRLVQLHDDGLRQPPLIARSIKLEDRVVAELLGAPEVDGVIRPYVQVSRPTRALGSLALPAPTAEMLTRAMAMPRPGPAIALDGGYGSGRRAIPEALCAQHGLALLTVNLERLAASDLPPAETMGRILREATLQGAAILWGSAEAVLEAETPTPWRAALLTALEERAEPAFLALLRPWESRGRTAPILSVSLTELSYRDRARLWRERLGPGLCSDDELETLSSAFRLSGGQIRDVVAAARAQSAWQGRPTTLTDLYATCRALSGGALGRLAYKIRPTYAWDDLVLPPDRVERLKEICIQMRHRQTVLEVWGFGRHLAMGKGINVLFAGESGTGKTMAAEIIAVELGLDLFKVDLAGMVSKYIGETEKNLDQVFTAAREANAILFFDEADALFGKRSEVRDAHDRYANIEVGYLLQRMESYDGVVVLATNLRNNMDDAFVRRLHMVVDFPFPEEAERERIWRKVFPPATPLAPDVSLPVLAAQFKLAGGNIRNVALLAAYLAAESNGPIGMAHLLHAVRREYQKLGRMINDADLRRAMSAATGS